MRLQRQCGCSKRKLVLLLAVFGTSFVGIIHLYHEELHVVQKEYSRNMVTVVDVMAWVKNRYTSCDGHFVAYGNQFAALRDVVILPGDNSFYIPCPDARNIKYSFDFGKEGTHLNKWLTYIQPLKKEEMTKFNMNKSLQKEILIAVKRYEYANLYHTMTDWYNVFLVTQLLDIDINNIGILLYDNSTRGHMDETWNTLFGEVYKVPELKGPVVVEKLIWNILGYESPANYHGLQNLPFVESFHNFFREKHGVSEVRNLNCDKLSIFFLWRRDYIAHPNNPSGEISRKVANEDSLIENVKKHFPTANVMGDNLEHLTFREQVKLISSTDILISMHGAGLSHILLLPKHAAVLEIFPLYWMKFPFMKHFEAMAHWRGLKYTSLQNLNPSNEVDHWKTFIPPTLLVEHVQSLYEQSCPIVRR